MAIDLSIYGLSKPVAVPSYAEAVQQAQGAAHNNMTMSHLAMQMQQLQRSAAEEDAVKAALAQNVGADGQINQRGVLAALGKSSPASMLKYQEHFNKTARETAEGERSKAEAAQKILSMSMPVMDSLAKLPPEQRAAQFPKAMAYLESQGVPMHGVPTAGGQPIYDDGWFNHSYAMGRQMKDHLYNVKTSAEIGHMQAQTAKEYRDSRDVGKTLTPGQKHADETFAKDAADYYYGGGKAGLEKNFQQLNEAAEKLRKNPRLTGGLSTRIPFGSSDWVQDSVNPEMASVRDDIRGAIQSSLKQVLGGQYTEREGEAIFNRAFNPRLSAQENIRRVKAEMDRIQNMAAEKDASMQQFMGSGTLKGYSPAGTNLARTSGGQEKKYAEKAPAGPVKAGSPLIGTEARADEPAQNVRKAGSRVTGPELGEYAIKHGLTEKAARAYLKGAGYAVD